jgi:hypothetical protein
LGRRNRFSLLIEHDLFRPAFARRSVKPNDERCKGLRAGGKPVPAFRDHARAERQDPMTETEKLRDKPASTKEDRDAKRRDREKALDKALEDSFPASDPVSPSAPAPTRE